MTPSFFASSAIVERLERATSKLVFLCGQSTKKRCVNTIVTRLGGGAACFSGEGSPFDKVAGLGFEPLDDRELDAFENAVLSSGGSVQIELSTRATPDLSTTFSKRGYMLAGFEDVMALPLCAPVHDSGTLDFKVRNTTREETNSWIDTIVESFAAPDQQGVPSHESFPREAVTLAERDLMATPGMSGYLAHLDGVMMGGASMRIDDGVAQLTGAATVPAYRRRGVQSALLRTRLSDAFRAGADLATVTTQPGSKSQENAIRSGFSLVYTRAILIKSVPVSRTAAVDGVERSTDEPKVLV